MNYSLLSAANIDNDNNFYSSYSQQDTANNSTNNLISKKKNNNNKTQKKVSISDNDDTYFTPKVNKLMNALNNTSEEEEDDDGKLHNFTPISPPISAGVQNTILRDNSTASKSKYNANSANISDDPNQYVKQIIPPPENVINQYPLFNDSNYFSSSQQSYPSNYIQNYGINNNGGGGTGDDIMMRKLNYLIHLLEEKHDERTNNVMEEVILYSFIGIFVIFIVDNFTRVGRYKR